MGNLWILRCTSPCISNGNLSKNRQTLAPDNSLVMKNLIAIFALNFLTLSAFCQTKYPKGGYMSFDELKAKSPSLSNEIEVIKRTNTDIAMNGGNDYKLVSNDKTISGKILKKDCIAYSDGQDLFINGFQYGLPFWYAKIISEGKFLVMKAGTFIPANEINSLGYAYGAIGGAVQGAKQASLRLIYVIDKDFYSTNVNKEYMQYLLTETPEILQEYNSENEPSNDEVILKYLKRINE
jgi:hypothetical protein